MKRIIRLLCWPLRWIHREALADLQEHGVTLEMKPRMGCGGERRQ